MGCSASNINKAIVSPAVSHNDSDEAEFINQTSHSHSISLLREELDLLGREDELGIDLEKLDESRRFFSE